MLKSYFLAPSWDIRPNEVLLGSVIANIKMPHKALSAATLPTSIDSSVAPPMEEKPFSGVAKTSKEWNAGVFATFLQVITLGGQLSFSTSSAAQVEYSCDSMETQRFTPSSAYIAKAVEDPGVKEHLKMGGVGAKAFMITGIKVARKILITTTEEEAKETAARIGSAMSALHPTLGTKGSHKATESRQYTRAIEGPIVFAFQLEKVRVSRKGKPVFKEHVDGALLSRGKADEDIYVIERAGHDLEQEEVEDFDVEVRLGIDDETGEACEIILS